MRKFRKEHNIRYVSDDKVNNGYKKTIISTQSTTYTYGLGVVGLGVVGLGVVGLGVVGLGVVGLGVVGLGVVGGAVVGGGVVGHPH